MSPEEILRQGAKYLGVTLNQRTLPSRLLGVAYHNNPVILLILRDWITDNIPGAAGDDYCDATWRESGTYCIRVYRDVKECESIGYKREL